MIPSVLTGLLVVGAYLFAGYWTGAIVVRYGRRGWRDEEALLAAFLWPAFVPLVIVVGLFSAASRWVHSEQPRLYQPEPLWKFGPQESPAPQAPGIREPDHERPSAEPSRSGPRRRA